MIRERSHLYEELERIRESRSREVDWKRWGPYVAERAWGTVREDYSPDGRAWESFPYEHARARAYRWSEDGIAGICDRDQRICLALALWNGRDSHLKERLFGVRGPEGAGSLREIHDHLDNTPTHSYMRYLYRYPQVAFPYERLRAEPGLALTDTGVFEDDRYFDVFVEYAKATSEDILLRVTAVNRGPEAADLHLLPTIWFRNTWSWGRDPGPKPFLERAGPGLAAVRIEEPHLGTRWFHAEGEPGLLFTENETNVARLFGAVGPSTHVKDGIDTAVVRGEAGAIRPRERGTKATFHYRLSLEAGETSVLRLLFCRREKPRRQGSWWGTSYDRTIEQREQESDEFYAMSIPFHFSPDARHVARQAFAGLLWSKQFDHYVVEEWLEGDPGQPPPPTERLRGRNATWTHLSRAEVVSVPDKWTFPWLSPWDLAFQAVPLALIDADLAKEQLLRPLGIRSMRADGQLPADETGLSDAYPPVHAWAARSVHEIDAAAEGQPDRVFLERVFHALLRNHAWWAGRTDREGRSVFRGGFVGVDLLERGRGERPEMSEGTVWTGLGTTSLLAMAVDLARESPAYERVAGTLLERLLDLAEAVSHRGGGDVDMWSEEDGFHHDMVRLADGRIRRDPERTHVGLLPLLSVLTLDAADLERMPAFARRIERIVARRPDRAALVAGMTTPGSHGCRLISLVTPRRLRRILDVMLDEGEFLSPHGIRSHSRRTGDGDGAAVLFPLNALLIDALVTFHRYLGDDYRVEFPSGSGYRWNLREVAEGIARRLSSIFLLGPDGTRPVHGDDERIQNDARWRDRIPFHGRFDGETGRGLGTGRQAGGTALVAHLLARYGEPRRAAAIDLRARGKVAPVET